MNAQGHIIVPLERKGADGKDAVSIQPTTSSIVLSEGQTLDDWSLEVRAYRGGEQIALTRDMVAVTNDISGVTVAYTSTNGIITFGVTRDTATTEVDGTFFYTITIDEVAYTFTCGVKSVFNGDKGDKGDKGDTGDPGEPGEDAIYYELELSCETLEYNAFADAFAPSTITIQVVKVEGTTRSYVSFGGYVMAATMERFSYITSRTYTLAASKFKTTTSEGRTTWATFLTISVYPTENTAVQLTKTIYPNTSYYPRVRYWEDVAEGGQFCQGQLGEQYRDIVIYPKNANSPSYYYCRTSHTKSDDKVPVGDNTDQYWKAVSYFEVVATGLLLADLAKINNLYVDDVFMVRENTAIWIDPLNEGMKINSTSKLTGGEDINDQNAEDWANPTTWFHGGTVPSVSQIYGQTTTSTSNYTVSAGTLYRNENDYAVTVSSQKYGSAVQVVASLPAGRSLIMTTNYIEKAFALTEGKYSTLSFGLTQSTAKIYLYKTVDGVTSVAFQIGTIVGAGQDNEGVTTYLMLPKFSISHSNTSDSTQAVSLQIGFEGGQFMAGAQLELARGFTISTSAPYMVEGYVSQFGADGLILGYNSQNYLMHKLSESLTQHTLLANNTGIDITQQGSMQVVGGNQMPLGGCLALVNITVGSGLASFDVWTFDGASLSGQYYGTGIYRVFFPSSWADKFGTFDMYKMVVTTSYQSNGSTIGVSVQKRTYSGYWGYLNIHVVNGTTYTDVPISLRIDYMSSVTSREMSQSTSAITPLSMIQDAEIINE